MTIVVGIPPEKRGRAAVHLAAILARSAGDDLILGAVVPRPWPPSPARVDAEYRAHFERAAEEALQQASAQLPADIASTALVHHARSAPAGLLEVADQNDASVIVVGSSSAGVVGRVAWAASAAG
jgi:nucleotide-binding universal stress UspA family protein